MNKDRLNAKDRFDLEQEIMQCWGVVDDLKMLYSRTDSCSEDELQNALLGIIQLYQWKFETLFNTFEQCVSEGEL